MLMHWLHLTQSKEGAATIAASNPEKDKSAAVFVMIGAQIHLALGKFRTAANY
jgi:hypothetical protein